MQRKRLTDDIFRLGGDVYNEEFLDETVTHIICAYTNRGQKYLSGLARGVYILHMSYIEDSVKYGRFIEEDPYEFGNPLCKRESHIPAKDMDLVHAAYRWRMKIQNEKKFAFSGFKVLFVCGKDKIRQFVAIIQSGGGTYFEAYTPFSRRAVTGYGITHCFIDNKIKLDKSDMDILKKANIPLVLMMYLNIFLLAETTPPLSKYLVKE